MLDTGAQILQLSVDHRVATHRAERHRLERTGALIAPIDVSGERPSFVSAYLQNPMEDSVLHGVHAEGWGHPYPLEAMEGSVVLSSVHAEAWGPNAKPSWKQ